jgi:hypothetical protein
MHPFNFSGMANSGNCGLWSILTNEIDVDWKATSQENIEYLLGRDVDALGLSYYQKPTHVAVKLAFNLLHQKFLIALRSHTVFQFIPNDKNKATYILFNTSYQTSPDFKDIFAVLHFYCFTIIYVFIFSIIY